MFSLKTRDFHHHAAMFCFCSIGRCILFNFPEKSIPKSIKSQLFMSDASPSPPCNIFLKPLKLHIWNSWLYSPLYTTSPLTRMKARSQRNGLITGVVQDSTFKREVQGNRFLKKISRLLSLWIEAKNEVMLT